MADVLEFAGRIPPYRIKAWTGRLNGEIMGIGGIGRHPEGYDLVFFDCKPEARTLGPVTLAKMGRRVMQEIQDMGLSRVYAEADENVEAAGPFLEWLGFKHLEDEVWIYEA